MLVRMLDLDGRFLRMIAERRFRRPQAVAASHGRAFVVDDKTAKVLHIIDIQSGVFLQTVRLEIEGPVSAIIADGDEIYIADKRQVVVLQLAGSEA